MCAIIVMSMQVHYSSITDIAGKKKVSSLAYFNGTALFVRALIASSLGASLFESPF